MISKHKHNFWNVHHGEELQNSTCLLHSISCIAIVYTTEFFLLSGDTVQYIHNR